MIGTISILSHKTHKYTFPLTEQMQHMHATWDQPFRVFFKNATLGWCQPAQPSLSCTCVRTFWAHPGFKFIKVNSTCWPEAFPAKHTGAAATWQHGLCNQDIDFPKLASHIGGAWNMLRDSDEHGLDLISKHRAPWIPHQSQAEVSKASRRQQADYLPKWKCVCVCCHHGSLAVCPCGDQRSLTH